MHVRVYALSLAGTEVGTPEWWQLLARLSPEERARAERYRIPRVAQRFAAAHSALRQILAREIALACGVADGGADLAIARGGPGGGAGVAIARGVPGGGADLAIARGPYGKPYLRDYPQCQFSLSHSADVALVAVCRGVSGEGHLDEGHDVSGAGHGVLGVDVESLANAHDYHALSRRYFSSAENAALERGTEDDYAQRFLRIWTRKEAFTKALGTGLHTPLDSFVVPPALAPRPLPVLSREPLTWYVCDLGPLPGCVASLCLPYPDFTWELCDCTNASPNRGQ